MIDRTPLPYRTPLELWAAFRSGARFVLHYHGKSFDVKRMSPREKVVYVQPPGFPVKVLPDGGSAEGPCPIWLEQAPDDVALVARSLAVSVGIGHGLTQEQAEELAPDAVRAAGVGVDAAPNPQPMPPRLLQALARRNFRAPTDMDDLIAMAANIIAEDGFVIDRLQAKLASGVKEVPRG